MNAVIVRVLEKEFPDPWPLDVRVKDLLDLLGALRKVRGYEGVIDPLTGEILETIEGIASGRVPDLDEATRNMVRKSLGVWRKRLLKEEEKRVHLRETDEDEK